MEHHSPELISQAAMLFGTALTVSWAFRYLQAPTIIGYLITGLIIGPSALAFIDADAVSTFAEVGLVLLLFIIGLELSPQPLMQAGPRILMATGLQLVLTAIPPALLSMAVLKLGLGPSLLLGAAVSLSSTAITLKVLLDRREVASAVGNLSTGILLLQDVYVLALMILVPVLAASGGGAWQSAMIQSGKGLAGIVVIVVILRFLLPGIIRQITRHGGPELLTLFAVVMAAGGAWVAEYFGWPLALGACMAGLLLAQADVRHQIVADISPFRDVFNALFFISLGMLVNLAVVMQYAPYLVLAIALTLLAKTIITAGVVRLAGWPLRLSVQAGLGLCTVSEFGYVLAREADHVGVFGKDTFVLDLLIPLAVGTMLVGALLVPLSGRIALLLVRGGKDEEAESTEPAESHVIIVGFGINGANLARVLNATHIPFGVVEMNPSLVAEAKSCGAHVHVGDAARMAILEGAGIDQARALVIAINDIPATRHIVAQARARRPDLYIIVRTPFASELEPLYARGASFVVPADFEVSIKIFAQLLTELDIPDNVIQAQIASVRAGGYGVLRGAEHQRGEHLDELLEVFRVTATQTFYVRDDSPAAGCTLMQSDLRRATGVNIIAVVRNGKAHTNPGADFVIEAGDVLVLLGTHAQLNQARQHLSGATAA
ncbi:MAG: hypothetical protein GC168_08260 [Candidatus Hydrogenedens sp.]|nr:hypothetical protein [Candidatus Hydrogenedens sp.]